MLITAGGYIEICLQRELHMKIIHTHIVFSNQNQRTDIPTMARLSIANGLEI